MKIVHTADWHLGDRLGRIDRSGDLKARVEQVAAICLEERAEVLIVAGDLFSELARNDTLRDSIAHLQRTMEPFLQRGGTIFAITGNHDNENFCQTLRHAMTLASPQTLENGRNARPGRLYLADEPSTLELLDAHGLKVRFVLMPFPTSTQYLLNEPLQRYTTLAEKKQGLVAAFKSRLAQLRSSAQNGESVPEVLVAHLSVVGADLYHRFRLSEAEDVVLDDQQLGNGFAYVALGHIHRSQDVGGNPLIRYSGSIDRLDLGESTDRKSVVAFHLTQEGVQDLRTIPLDATPVYEVVIDNPSFELPQLRDRYPDHASALVRVSFRYQVGRDSLEGVLKELAEVFPRWYAREWAESSALSPPISSPEHSTSSGFSDTVRNYIRDELVNHSEEERKAINALAEELLAEEGGGQ